MNVNIHIERLVLDGLPITRSQGTIVQAAVEAELARLIAAGELKADLLGGGARPSAKAGSIQLANDPHPVHLGRQIAQAVYSRLGPPERVPGRGDGSWTSDDA